MGWIRCTLQLGRDGRGPSPGEDHEPDEVRLQQDSAAGMEKLECSWGMAKAVLQLGQSGGLLKLGGRSLVQKQWQVVHCTQLKQLCTFGLSGAFKEGKVSMPPRRVCHVCYV